jgi:hypothetical protein
VSSSPAGLLSLATASERRTILPSLTEAQRVADPAQSSPLADQGDRLNHKGDDHLAQQKEQLL